MQVRFGKAASEWHRFALDHDSETRTACGKPITSYRASREPKYEEPLCRDGCFTPYEIKLAGEIAATRFADELVASDAFDAAFEARAAEREEARVRRESERSLNPRAGTVDEEDP